MAFFRRNLRENKDEVDDDDEDVEIIVDAEDEKRMGELLRIEELEAIESLDVWRGAMLGRMECVLIEGSVAGGSSSQYKSIIEETSSQ